MYRSILTITITAILAGCSTLPRDGPSGRAVESGADAVDSLGGYSIVELDYAASEGIKAVAPQFFGSLTGADTEATYDVIGVGDSISVSIYEPGGSLFASGGGSTDDGVQSGNQSLPGIVVERAGTVQIPFAGAIRVAGLTSGQAAAAIRRALIGKVGNPQVLVSITASTSNAVTILGSVRQPGRVPLTVNANRILDIIAASGGTERATEDVVVTIQRQGQTFSAPLSSVTTDFNENTRLVPGDQINLAYKPRRYSTFGALGAIALTEMASGDVTLAGALSRVGGLETNSANARSVLVFRFERPEVAQALGVTRTPTVRGVPVVYRLNLEEASGFFTANNFIVQPDDILYVPRSSSAELRKFFELVQSVTRVVYDVSVTSTLNTN